jgi:hypothetical protein
MLLYLVKNHYNAAAAAAAVAARKAAPNAKPPLSTLSINVPLNVYDEISLNSVVDKTFIYTRTRTQLRMSCAFKWLQKIIQNR